MEKRVHRINKSMSECDLVFAFTNQQQMGELYQTVKSTLSEHIKNILQEGELVENSVVRNFRTTASDGKNYNVTYYALPMVLAVGFRVRSIRGNRIKSA